MSVRVLYFCSECDAVESGSKALGLNDTVVSVAPIGWTVYELFTNATYCSKCWAEIESGKDE